MKAAAQSIELDRLRSAWQGRVSGCLLGKPLEVLSFREGLDGVRRYLGAARALPLRDYVPFLDGMAVRGDVRACCLGRIERAEPDDDIDYTLLALALLEEHGPGFGTEDVARHGCGYCPREPRGRRSGRRTGRCSTAWRSSS
jgi:hypothetical protein